MLNIGWDHWQAFDLQTILNLYKCCFIEYSVVLRVCGRVCVSTWTCVVESWSEIWSAVKHFDFLSLTKHHISHPHSLDLADLLTISQKSKESDHLWTPVCCWIIVGKQSGKMFSCCVDVGTKTVMTSRAFLLRKSSSGVSVQASSEIRPETGQTCSATSNPELETKSPTGQRYRVETWSSPGQHSWNKKYLMINMLMRTSGCSVVLEVMSYQQQIGTIMS